MATLYAGTSGFAYPAWKPGFYPAKLPSKQFLKHYAERLKRVPKAWEKAFEVNPSENEAVRASCIEFVLAGLYADDRISRSQKLGKIV